MWCVEGMRVIYKWDNFITKAGRPTRYIWDEIRIELLGIVGEPNLWATFDRYQLRLMTRTQGSYNQALVCEFYASYATIITLTTPKGDRGTT